MYVSERCCSAWGFCACRDGDRGLGSCHRFPGALQSVEQSQGLMESALPPMLCTSCPAPFLPSTGASSHLSSCCGEPPALKTSAGLPGHQVPHSLVPQTQLPGQPRVPVPCPRRRTTSSDGPSCHQGMGALVLAVPEQTVSESPCSLFPCEGGCCFKGHEVLKPGARGGGYWKQELGNVARHQILDSKLEFHGWQSLAGQAHSQAKPRAPGAPQNLNF